MATGTCPTCGAPSEALTDHGLQHFITELDVDNLAALFFKKLDVVKCQVCGRSLGVRPTVIVELTKSRMAHVVIGSRLEADREAFLSSLRETHRELGLALQEMQSFDALRKAVARDLSSWFPALNDLSKAIAEGNLADHITEHWRTLTPIFFTVARLTAVGLIPGVRHELYKAKTPDPKYSPEEALQQLTLAQVYVWGALCDSWGSDEKHSPSFERDLQRFIDPGIPFRKAVEPLRKIFDQLQADPQVSAGSQFCMEAILASLCAVLQQPNPHANSWAEHFFAHELACRLGGDKVSPRIRAMLISEERARATIDFHPAWDAVARRLSNNSDSEELREIEQIAAKAGYPDLVDLVKREGVELLAPAETPFKMLIMRLVAQIEARRQSTGELFVEDIFEKSQPYARWLVKHRRVDDLEHLADYMIEWMDGTDDARAHVDAWLGSHLKLLRLPQRFLARVGETPRVWEFNLPVIGRVRLWTERANALRLAGRFEEALSLSEEIERLQIDSSEDLDDPTREWLHSTLHTTQLNIAILLRDTGSPDSALEILNALLNETPEDKQIDLLRSLAVTYSKLGKLENTVSCYNEALELAAGPRAGEAPGIRASRASILANLGRYEESLRDLKEFNPESSSDPRSAFLSEASAWITLMVNEVSLPRAAISRLRQVYENLTTIAKEAEEDGDVDSHLGALRTMAHFWEVLDKPETECEQLWEWAYMAALQYEQVPDPVALLSLAYYAYKQDESEKAREYLMQVSWALASHLGGVIDLDLAVKGAIQLPYKLDQLARVVLDRPTNWDDIRMIAELQRDVIGRAQTLRRRSLIETDITVLSQGLTDEVLAQLSPETGRIGVLEWVDGGEWYTSFLTCITSDGQVSSYWLKQPEVGMRAVVETILSRLNTWDPHDQDDPFDEPEWQKLEEWLVDVLSPCLATGDHLVVIEHDEIVGVPWHVAAAPQWTCSYISSWTALLSLHSLPAPGRASTLGVALVPRFKEAPQLLESMRQSLQRTQAFTIECGLGCSIAEGGTCDHDAFIKMMGESDLVKLICHGFITRDGDVALVLAHNGFLPLRISKLGGESGRVYRFSWRDCQRLPTAPDLVFSAACSTGYSHIAGLGERLGLFSALRYAGTRALVAPRWDIHADRVLPILDDALERYTKGDISLIRALQAACSAAEQPRWLAWALALEGDWRCHNH